MWPSFDASRVLFEDGSIVVIDKPEGMSSQAADPARPDDVLTRLGEHLGGYLGLHQRLDKETSGVMVLARDKASNPSLAAQFEGRTVEKSYVAAVRGWRGGARELRHYLSPRRGGGSVVHERASRGSKEAISFVTPLRKVGDRALLRVQIKTGRTHQIRAQLAAIGAPIAGDTEYGGAEASRLMLHAERLAFRHPKTEAELSFQAPLPPLFEAFLTGETEPFGEVLARAIGRRFALSREAGTSVFRLLHGEGEGAPGVCVDYYAHEGGVHLVAHFYDHPAEDVVLDALAALPIKGVYVKRHPRQANELGAAGEALAPPAPLRGEGAPAEIVALENGLRYSITLSEGLPTGLYLDQRDARGRVMECAKGKRLLNLFAYTGGFSLAAAAGGALATMTVDASRAALQRFERNLALNGLAGDHVTKATDCFELLPILKRSQERFDLVICDPPTYARTKRSRWSSGPGWVDLSADCFAVSAAGAELLFSSNDARMPMQRFRRYVHEGAAKAGVAISSMRDLPTPADFPGSRVKRLWVRR